MSEEEVRVECSRCDAAFRSLEGCCCFLDIIIGPEFPPPPRIEDEEPLHPFDQITEDALLNGELAPGYGSRHDLCAFVFINPKTSEKLTKHEILSMHHWIEGETNICDDCIDDMLQYKELKKTWDDCDWRMEDDLFTIN